MKVAKVLLPDDKCKFLHILKGNSNNKRKKDKARKPVPTEFSSLFARLFNIFGSTVFSGVFRCGFSSFT